jgi:hypothetical protein
MGIARLSERKVAAVLEQKKIPRPNIPAFFALCGALLFHASMAQECTVSNRFTSDTVESGGYFIASAEHQCSTATFAWYRNNVLIPGAVDSVLILDGIGIADTGAHYYCIITSGAVVDTAREFYLTVLAPTAQNRVITVTGDLLDANNKAVGKDRFELMNFTVYLYSTPQGGTPVYTEVFRGNQRILVRNSHFSVPIGKGSSQQNLQKTVAGGRSLYVELYAGTGGREELIGPRIMLSAAPYAFSSGVNVIKGNGNPASAAPSQTAVGTIYLDVSDNNRTWKRTSAGWVKID